MYDLTQLHEKTAQDGGIPLAWVRSNASFPYSNLGDALSAIIAAGLSGLPVRTSAFRSDQTRIASIGTIGHNLVGGIAYMWGTGLDRTINVTTPEKGAYEVPPNTDLRPLAVRGPHTRKVLQDCGLDTPAVYGDPAWFLPRIYAPKVEKTHDLGVIVHISELDAKTDLGRVKAEYQRYLLPEGGPSIRIINTYHQPDYASLCAKMDEILSCRRILSTSFHGVLLADTYGIPCSYFSLRRGGGQHVDPVNQRELLDHRIADFYAGAKVKTIPIYHQPRAERTDWEQAMSFIDTGWAPIEEKFEDLLAAFPYPLVSGPTDDVLRSAPI